MGLFRGEVAARLRLTTAMGDDTEPAWSRDGTKLAFTSNRGSTQQDVYVMNATVTNSATKLTTNSAADHFPDW